LRIAAFDIVRGNNYVGTRHPRELFPIYSIDLDLVLPGGGRHTTFTFRCWL